MVLIKKSTNNCWRGCGKGEPYALLAVIQIGAATVENNMEVPQKVKNRTTIWPSNSTLGIYPNKSKILVWKDICTPVFISALYTIVKVWKQPKRPSIDKCIQNMCYLYTMMYHSAAKVKSVRQGRTSTIRFHLYVEIYKTKYINEQTEQKQTLIEQTDGCQMGGALGR